MQSNSEVSVDNFLNIKPKTINKHQAKHKTSLTVIHISDTQFDTSKLLRKAFPLFLSVNKGKHSSPCPRYCWHINTVKKKVNALRK